VNWNDFDGALFDLDGVLTPTPRCICAPWQQLFIDFLTKRGITQPYVESDYFDYIDGKPRYDGVRALLASRSITLAEGDPSDSPETETVCGLGNRKNAFFNSVLAEDGVEPYAGSVQLLDFLEERGIKVAGGLLLPQRSAGAGGVRARPAVRGRRRRQRGHRAGSPG
jgi:beta-phosphoglucomutase-like phosphatase (HAD superfamily)